MAFIFLGAFATVWIVGVVLLARSMVATPALSPLLKDASHSEREWPLVSIVIPACNEADTLRDATLAKLSTDYPNIEVLLVDDRSTDATGEIADQLATLDNRVRALHIETLPDGWLGKLHALHIGTSHARGEWLLFTDADVHWEPQTIRAAVAQADHEKLDFIALIPRFLPGSLALDIALTTFLRLLVVFGQPWKVRDAQSHVALGGGPFNLVRRGAYERSPGFPWLKLEVADDVALAQTIKASGGSCAAFNASDLLYLHYYRTLPEMVRGLEKNTYAVGARYNLFRLALGVAFFLSIELSPLALIVFGYGPARLYGIAALASAIGTHLALNRWAKRSLLAAFFPTIGGLIIAFVMVRSGILAELRGGIAWRGTLYPLDALRKGQRLKF